MENFDNLVVDINPEYTMKKKLDNGLYLSQEAIDVLESFQIDYKNCKSLNDLIYEVEIVFDETEDPYLDNLLQVLSEQNYYENYNK